MNEIVYLGRRAVAYGALGLGDVGDLLAYRQEWEPFIKAHLDLWRNVNSLLEGLPETAQCPAGIFKVSQIPSTLSPTMQSFCASLSLSRSAISDTDPSGILTKWNAWQGKSDADILAGANSMLGWLQSVVMLVGGAYKDQLVQIADTWKISIQLPDVPTFDTQQDVIARIQGAYVATKGILEIVGYGAGETLVAAGDLAQATAQGLKQTVQDLPKTASKVAIVLAVTAVVVGGVLVIYYHPRRPRPAA